MTSRNSPTKGQAAAKSAVILKAACLLVGEPSDLEHALEDEGAVLFDAE